MKAVGAVVLCGLAACAVAPPPPRVTVSRDRTAVGVGQKIRFTFRSPADYDPDRWRIMAYCSEDPKPIFLTRPGETQVRESAPARRSDVGRSYTACIGAWDLGTPEARQVFDEAEAGLVRLLQSRRAKSEELPLAADKVNEVDDQALAAMRTARDKAEAIVNAGAPGAEKAAEQALKAGDVQADKIWADAKADIAHWNRILKEMEEMDTRIRVLFESAAHVGHPRQNP